MKKTTYATIGLGVCAAAALFAVAQESPAPAVTPAPAAAPAPAPTAEEVRQGFSYLIGQQLGSSLATDLSELRIEDVDPAMLLKGLKDGMANRVDPEMAKKDVRAIMQAFLMMMEQRVMEKSAENLKIGKAFLEENAKKEGVVTTASGLQYKVLSAGTGEKYDANKHGKSPIASVIYEGRKVDGTVFDSSAEPVDFPIDQVIPGFTEALKLMPIGSEWEVYIPADLGYGASGPGVIGPNSTLIFKMKLVAFKPGRGSQLNPIQLTPEQLQGAGMVPVTP